MSLIALKDNKVSSLELLEEINFWRNEESRNTEKEKSEMQHNDLLKVIRDEFEEEISLGNISPSEYITERNRKYPKFDLTISQAKQVLVRESKYVRKAVIKRLEELENKLKKTLPQTYKEALQELLVQIEENERLELENKAKQETITRQKNTIHELTSDVDSVVLRKTFTDYVTKVAKNTGVAFAELYTKIYSLVGRILKIDLKYLLGKFSKAEREIVDNNKTYNAEHKLKGNDRVTPYKYADSKTNISMVEYIIDILKEPQTLIEAVASVCEVGISEILDTYQMFKVDEAKSIEI